MEYFINGTASTLSDFLGSPLERAVIISLFTWRRADPDDKLPGSSKYGWWGDTYAEVKGDRIGSKLWLLMRSKLTNEVLAQAKEYAEESLQWLIEDQVAKSVTVEVERGGLDQLNLKAIIAKPDKSELNLRFQNVWEK